MIEDGTGATAAYTDAARARLVMAYEACELADLARAFVPIGEHELNPDGINRSPGTVLADALRVITAAQRFFDAAAVFERMSGADWQVIGDALEVSPRTARIRFAMAEAAFRELLSPKGCRPPVRPVGCAATWPGNRWKWPSISTTGSCATRTATVTSAPRRSPAAWSGGVFDDAPGRAPDARGSQCGGALRQEEGRTHPLRAPVWD